ncbi:hypothetical protein TTHERM_001103819, partial (macronuclear) [Tetrahymena thermophila SB210]
TIQTYYYKDIQKQQITFFLYFQQNQYLQKYKLMERSNLNKIGSHRTLDKLWISDYINSTVILQNSLELKAIKNLQDKPNQDSKEIYEVYSNFQESTQIQGDNYETNDLIEKFDNISKNNISKNIIKAFFSYMLDTKDNEFLTDFVFKGSKPSQARKMIKNYFKSYGFNNNSLLKLIQHHKYGKAFEFYLTFEAERWLVESKVCLKETHFIYIDFLKLCCSNPKYSNHLVTYKKNKKSLYDDRI